jgi:hypothetical protein
MRRPGFIYRTIAQAIIVPVAAEPRLPPRRAFVAPLLYASVPGAGGACSDVSLKYDQRDEFRPAPENHYRLHS